MRKSKERTREQKNGELRLIIEEFACAMWSVHRPYIANSDFRTMTRNMQIAWAKYVVFCTENPE